jgi:hypothetical protein
VKASPAINVPSLFLTHQAHGLGTQLLDDLFQNVFGRYGSPGSLRNLIIHQSLRADMPCQNSPTPDGTDLSCRRPVLAEKRQALTHIGLGVLHGAFC